MPWFRHHRHRVVLAGIAAGNVVEARGRNRGGGLPAVAGHHALDGETLVVPQQHRNLVVVLGGVQGDDAIAVGVVHVDDVEGETFTEPRQHQAGAVHGVAKAEESGQVVSAGAALVGGQHEEGFGGPDGIGLDGVVVEGNLGHGGAGATDVARWRIDQQVLAGAVEPELAGDLRSFQEGIPRELVHRVVVVAAGVRGSNANVVAGVADVGINEEPVRHCLVTRGAHGLQHSVRRFGVTAN